MRAAVKRYFHISLAPEDVVSSFWGVRPLVDDGAESLREVTRDYVIRSDAPHGEAPLLNIYGGKLTTFRKLAESALARLSAYFPGLGAAWTADAFLPGASEKHPPEDPAALPGSRHAHPRAGTRALLSGEVV